MNDLRTEKIKWCAFPEMICVLLITFFTMLGQSSIVSLVFYGSFLIILLACIQRVSTGEADIRIFSLVALSVLAVSFNWINNGRMFVGFDYFKKIIMFLSSMLFFYYASEMVVSVQTIRKIKICMFATAAILPISFYIMGNNMQIAHLITINYSNPNFAGMWLLACIVVSVYLLFSVEYFSFKILAAVIAIINIHLLIMNNTRSCILALVSFAVLLLIGLIRKKYNYSKLAIVLIVLLPLIVAIVYLLLVDNASVIAKLDFMVSEGKALESRSGIWRSAVDFIKNSPIIGDYWGISNGTGESQLHNTAIDVISSYGILVYVIYIYILYQCTSWISQSKSLKGFVAMTGFLAVLISGCFEAALVAGSMGLSIYAGMLLVVSRYEYEE